jgi:putrescine transport system substrate-binding protein
MMIKRISFLVVAIALAGLNGANAADKPTLNIYNWSDYIAPDTLEKFTKETGIEVNYDTYDSNETLDAKLAAGSSGYDLVVPTLSPWLARQLKAGYYQPLDKSKLPNYKNLDPKILARMSKIDVDNAHAIPWGISTIGIIYNEDQIKKRMPDAPVDSLSMMFDVKILSKFKDCGISFLDSPTEVFPAALKYLGLNPDTQNVEDLKKAADLMLTLRPYIRKFDSSGYLNDLANGDSCLVWGYLNDGIMSRRRAIQAGNGVKIKYVIPKEGTQFFLDTMAMPKDAPHPDLAYKFLDFVMRPDISAALGNFLFLQTGNLESEKLLRPEILSDPGIFPPAATWDKLYLISVATPELERQRTRQWTRIKTNR